MHSTAITRKNVSRPMRWILDNVLTEPFRILHYGEGKAYFDTYALSKGSIYPVEVYEPHPAENEPWKKDVPLGYFDLCISVYVLNTLVPSEREFVIWQMTNKADRAIAAVRTDKINGRPMFDGVITSRNTFQKSFSRSECEELGKVLTYNSSFAIIDLY